MNENEITVEAVVLRALGGIWFEVELDFSAKSVIKAYISGKIRKNNIHIIAGDKVTIKFSEYDTSQGIIVYRNR